MILILIGTKQIYQRIHILNTRVGSIFSIITYVCVVLLCNVVSPYVICNVISIWYNLVYLKYAFLRVLITYGKPIVLLNIGL